MSRHLLALQNAMRLAALCWALLTPLQGCGDSAPPAPEPAARTSPETPPNLLLVTIDTLRADHLSFYGYDRETMPNLAGWVDEAAVFERYYTPLPLTDPAFASLMTGLSPMRHGVRHTARRLDPSFKTLAQILRGKGWDTAAFVSRKGLLEGGNLDRGFTVANFQGGNPDALGLIGERANAERWQRRAADVTDIALLWIWKRAQPPFFVWLHYYDPHAFYDAPPPFRGRFASPPGAEPGELGLRAWWGSEIDARQAIGDYDAEVLYVDQQIARVVDHLKRAGLWDSTLFVLTSDHGESLGEHGHMDHGEWLYEEQLRVPLVLRHPALIPAGSRIPQPALMVDLAPTLLDLLGVSGDDAEAFAANADGRSLRPLLQGEGALGGAPDDRLIFFESENCPDEEGRANAPGMICHPAGIAGKIRAVSDGRWKLIVTPQEEGRRVELYDLVADPKELSDLSQASSDRVREMAAALDAHWQVEVRAEAVDAELADQLRALGYGE
jgi:arylsulfatase A-like enzyme